MQRLVWIYLAILVGTVWAQTSTPPASRKAAKPTTTTAKDVQELRDALAAQQQQMREQREQIDQLKNLVQQLTDATQTANANSAKLQTDADLARQQATAAQNLASDQKETVDRLVSTVADVRTSLASSASTVQEEQKRVSALESLVGRFRFVGDMRIRGESFFQDCATCVDRNRARIRLRFGAEGQLNQDFLAGFSLATGSLGDPTTTNETMTNFFDRKTIGVDRAYITYNPVALHWLSITGGKFAYQWQRTQVTGDPDINPEGFTARLSFDTKTKFVKNVSLQAIEYMLNENSTGTDTYALGGQLSSRLQFGPWTTTPSVLFLKWNNPDAVLQASAFAVQATNGGKGIPTPGEGPGCAKGLNLPTVPPCAFSPNGMTNATYLDPSGKPHLYSQFLYADFVLNNQIKTGWDRFPVNLLLEYENNLDAKDHPLDFAGNVATNLGKQSHTYLVDVSLGQTKNKYDLQIGYAWLREEQDAAIASFAESDQRGPTNILQNRVYALWKVRPNTVAGFTWWHGRALNTWLENSIATLQGTITAPGQQESYLNRFQFDLIYTF